jgi:hypothetical protein
MRKYSEISLISLALIGLLGCGSDSPSTSSTNGDGDNSSGDGDGDEGDGDTGDGDEGDGDTGDGDTGDGDKGDGDTGDGDTSTGDGDTSTGDGDTSTGDGDTTSTNVHIDSIEIGKGEKITEANMIDDLEDNDDTILANDKRLGSWYTYHDDESTGAEQTPGTAFKPTAGGAEDSKYAAATKGKGYKSYAGMGFDLNNDGKTVKAYDASKFKGISFLAKGNVDLRVGIATSVTVTKDSGGTCSAGADKCDDTHGVDVTVEKDWAKYDIPFAKIKQEGWGKAEDFDPATVLGISFSVPENASFDFAIDDIGFY